MHSLENVFIYTYISLQIMMVLDVVFLQILVIEDGNKPSLHDQTLE